MKKLSKGLLILLIVISLCGCKTINQMSYEEIIRETSRKSNLTNRVKQGYKYYLPHGMKVLDTKDYNEILSDHKYKYYMYVDVVSYYNNIKFDYREPTDNYYALALDNGYLEINTLQNNKYIIEIMQNYAKIEVIVEKCDIKESLTRALIILSSIEYRYDVLNELMKDDVLTSDEIEFNIFKTINKDNVFTVYDEEDSEGY